jgi:4-hydroxy-4-methyl-2-oxoglutarate aldolase
MSEINTTEVNIGESKIAEAFWRLSTPLVADACLSVGVALRVAPAGISSLTPRQRLAGRVLPAEHAGSVDVFLEALRDAVEGDVLVIGNQGRLDEGCIGDMITLEVKASGLAGIIVYGAHRDTDELLEIGFPVFSYASCPAGPRRLDPRESDALSRAGFSNFTVGRDDAVFADADGVVFVPLERVGEVLRVAENICRTERAQAEAIKAGVTLSRQLGFGEFLSEREKDPALTFREHLRRTGGAVEV